MKEIKALIHANRIAEVIEALSDHGCLGAGAGAARPCHNISASEAQSLSRAVNSQEQHYSLSLGQQVINQYKLEVLCEDDHVDDLVTLIAQTAQTALAESDWIYVTDVAKAVRIVHEVTPEK